MQIQGIACFDDECITNGVLRIGKQDLLAASGIHVHAGGNGIKAASLQPRNERAKLGENAFHLLNSHAAEHFAGDFYRLAG